jgi:hypothetical protein
MSDNLVQCVRLQIEGEPYLIGEFSEFHDLFATMVPDAESISEGQTLTITFPRLSRGELDAIPEFEG